jgi:Carboxypeptidase regulatory-like domain
MNRVSFRRNLVFAVTPIVGTLLLVGSIVGGLSLISTTALHAQTATTGAISGVVSDSTGAILPNAQVTISQAGTGEAIKVTSNIAGRYSADLLKPGQYTVSATTQDFKSNTIEIFVALSQTTPVDIKMVPAGTVSLVEVSAESVPLIDQENVALVTTLTESQIRNLPTPGGDVTTVAFTAPGVVVNAGGSYGNFSSNGLPGISNLFVLNGFDNQDPFLNLNNSGSSNLTLGQGELAEVAIVQNGYNSQYGRAAGAIINYTTTSGSNHFHGMADYYNNTSVMNANGWYNEYLGGARPHAVSNQWAANLGGPILKDKVFFFADYEGLRYVLPGANGLVNFPTPALQSYILGKVPAAATGLYQQAFAAYQSAASYGKATPVTTGPGANQDSSGNLGCGSLAGTPTGTGRTFGVDTPCVMTSVGAANNINKEWLFTGRVDWKASDKQSIYGRFKMDRGSQPTYTNFINPLFNAVSIQPEDEGQFNHTYLLSSHATNVFVLAANWYSAYFGPANNAASAAVYPDFLLPDLGYDGSGSNNSPGLTSLGVPGGLTQGRDVTQYQFEDDFNYIRGKHTLKAGFNFRRDDVTDYDSESNTVFPTATFYQLADYASGIMSSNPASSPYAGSNSYSKAFTNIEHAHLALYNIGIYFQDEYQVLPNLKLTLGARVDRTGDPLCNDNCFSQYAGAFPSSGASLTSPYSSAFGGPISPRNFHPYPSTQAINFQPRFGFNYSPQERTEIRGGVGLFSDLYPAGFLDSAIENFPNYNQVNIYSGVYGAAGTAGTLGNNAAAANSAIEGGFSSGSNLTQINNTLTAAGVPFTPPSIGAYFPAEFKIPEFLEYSLQIQRQLGRSDAVILTYAGNYGYDEVISNPYQNGASGVYQNATGTYAQASNGPLGNLPITPADPRFSRVTAYTNDAHSNYNGLNVTWRHTGHGFTGQLNYTYSHALDECSNGCLGEPFNSTSVLNQLTPSMHTQNLNYSNADYDVRNNLAGDLVYTEPKFFTNKYVHEVGDGWIIGTKTYYRGGVPFSVFQNSSVLSGYYNAGTTLMPDLIVAHATNTCVSNPHGGVTSGCLKASDYATTQNDFGNMARNSLRSPHYADTDLSITKDIVKREGLDFVLGGSAYNAWNHPNFAAPASTLGLSNFGQIQGTLAPPTSPYGSFQGAAVTQRIIQVHAKLTF